METHIRLSGENAQGIRVMAKRNFRSINGEVNAAVEEYLAKHREAMRKPKLNTKTKTP